MNEARQYLKHGKALCGKVFRNFVDTFNWLIDFCGNLKGDADVNDAIGKIVVDRSDPAHPVIRCKGCTRDAGGSSGDGNDQDRKDVVESLNGQTGSVNIIGGESIEVVTDGPTIRISYRDGKKPDETPKTDVDPCEHDPSGIAGGIAGGAGWGDDAAAEGLYHGGVPADGDESHIGDDNCNC